jgi:hypothetical protein
MPFDKINFLYFNLFDLFTGARRYIAEEFPDFVGSQQFKPVINQCGSAVSSFVKEDFKKES